jgi:DNA-binding transcriptional ArsR family regulator
MGISRGTRRGTRTVPRGEGRALEDLVRTVSALDGAHARALLSGLGEPLRARALRLLSLLERSSRSDRHGRLADAFTPRPVPGRAAEGIPGLLGIEVKRALAPRSPCSGPVARWARRLLLEIGAP